MLALLLAGHFVHSIVADMDAVATMRISNQTANHLTIRTAEACVEPTNGSAFGVDAGQTFDLKCTVGQFEDEHAVVIFDGDERLCTVYYEPGSDETPDGKIVVKQATHVCDIRMYDTENFAVTVHDPQ